MFKPFGRQRERLSWQLWISHLAVVVITLVAVVGAILGAAGFWAVRQGWTRQEPALEAQAISRTVGNLVRRGTSAAVIGAVLNELQEGGLRLTNGPFEGERVPRRFGAVPHWPDFGDLAWAVILGRDGQIVASSDETRFPVQGRLPEAVEGVSAAVTSRAWQGERDVSQLSLAGAGSGLSYGAYPILDEVGRAPVAVVLVAKEVPVARGPGFLVARALAVFSLATFVVLTVASAFALLFSGAAAYLLSRRISRRLERLSQATAAMAQGDLSQRVDPGPPDEIGSLSERFNLMASRLQESRAALEIEKQRVEETLRTKRELQANISHELRTPLALIRGHIESLDLDDAEGGRERAYLKVIQREVDHLNSLIEDLFALSTTEGGAVPLQVEVVQVEPVIEELVEALAPLARREQRVTLVARLEADLPPVLAERRRLEQVLSNLVRNALRYTPEGGLIVVSAGRGSTTPAQAPMVEVTVSDTGLGIPPEQLPQIFERFYRGDSARERRSGGVGLGLAIVRELVEAMGGYVRAESTPGEGSRFSFGLPSANGEARPGESEGKMNGRGSVKTSAASHG